MIRLHLSRGALVSSFTFASIIRLHVTGFVLIFKTLSLISATFTNEDGDEEAIAGCKDAPFYSTKVKPLVPENFGVWYADWFEPAKYVHLAAPCKCGSNKSLQPYFCVLLAFILFLSDQ